MSPLGRAASDTYASWFRALADGTRVQIVSLLARAGQPMTVGQIVSAVPVGQSTVSAHLRRLADAGFVLAEERGTSRLYRINTGCVTGFPSAADLIMGNLPAPAQPAQPAGAAGAAGALIREMRPEDAGPVLAIYQAGLDSGNASFETTAPDWDTFDRSKLPRHRHVAVAPEGQILGWAAAIAVSDRCVYQGVVEHSVYVAAAARGAGIGAALLGALIGSTEADGIWTIQSGVFPENTASLRLHLRAGFRVVGTRERVGRHHGRWRDVTFIERRSAIAGA